jgi:hypothetical protein
MSIRIRAKRKIAAIIFMIVPFVFWLTAIAGASASGFFENQTDVQLMVLGGALSMLAGTMFWD